MHMRTLEVPSGTQTPRWWELPPTTCQVLASWSALPEKRWPVSTEWRSSSSDVPARIWEGDDLRWCILYQEVSDTLLLVHKIPDDVNKHCQILHLGARKSSPATTRGKLHVGHVQCVMTKHTWCAAVCPSVLTVIMLVVGVTQLSCFPGQYFLSSQGSTLACCFYVESRQFDHCTSIFTWGVFGSRLTCAR